ncbi:MAG: hypothetical protein KGJ94_06955 [Xanthomonadaceae bacterium]|nr:hypothetical protein [Xanthomonadaceae bacterium]
MTVALSSKIHHTHKSIIELWQEMKSDAEFKRLCDKYCLPWDFDAGYEPRWYNGPRPEDVKVLFLMAEPGAITKTEKDNPRPAISDDGWPEQDPVTARKQENYWKENLYTLCSSIWPQNTRAEMNRHLAGSCTFWMSLPDQDYAKQRGCDLNQTSAIPRELEDYFLERYLCWLLAAFPATTIILAVGATKATPRLKRLRGLTAAPVTQPIVNCQAFTLPASNTKKAKDSWKVAACAIKTKLGL